MISNFKFLCTIPDVWSFSDYGILLVIHQTQGITIIWLTQMFTIRLNDNLANMTMLTILLMLFFCLSYFTIWQGYSDSAG
jgi:hypothetical protein